MRENPVKAALKAGKTVVGAGIGVAPNPLVVRIMANAGYDFLFIDTEHALISPENLIAVVQMARACGISPIVRPNDNEYHLIANALDSGADGLIIPRIETAEQAARLISYAKYPPLGIRGCGGTAFFDMKPPSDWSAGLVWLNEQTLICPQVESVTAIENLEKTLAIPGIDVIVIGPQDLSISLGVPGQHGHPKEIEAIDHVIAVCKKHGVPCGIVMGSGDLAKPWVEKGMQFVVAGTDQGMLLQTGTKNVQIVRAATGQK
jgi:2-dehydro-3-deoxyglucarate aldolase/4-hydroxy-2-oxoheptanedioate aldolase